MSNIILNFSPSGHYQLCINSGLPSIIQSFEEEFSRVCHEVEVFAVPIYIAIILAILAYSHNNLPDCLDHM